jgi:hypothetical protein
MASCENSENVSNRDLTVITKNAYRVLERRYRRAGLQSSKVCFLLCRML